MFVWYKNSLLASVVSFWGCALLVYGFSEFTNYGFQYGLPWFLAGIPFVVLAKLISNNKAFKKWWKQVEKAGMVPQIAKSNQIALDIYNKNPQKRTLKKIAALNPEAAAIIETSLAEKKR